MGLRALIRGLGVGGRKKREKSTGRASADGHRSIRKGGSTQAVNFPKQNIILILADDVGGILIRPHSMWFVDYLDCSQKEERKLHKRNLDCKP